MSNARQLIEGVIWANVHLDEPPTKSPLIRMYKEFVAGKDTDSHEVDYEIEPGFVPEVRPVGYAVGAFPVDLAFPDRATARRFLAKHIFFTTDDHLSVDDYAEFGV